MKKKTSSRQIKSEAGSSDSPSACSVRKESSTNKTIQPWKVCVASSQLPSKKKMMSFTSIPINKTQSIISGWLKKQMLMIVALSCEKLKICHILSFKLKGFSPDNCSSIFFLYCNFFLMFNFNRKIDYRKGFSFIFCFIRMDKIMPILAKRLSFEI